MKTPPSIGNPGGGGGGGGGACPKTEMDKHTKSKSRLLFFILYPPRLTFETIYILP